MGPKTNWAKFDPYQDWEYVDDAESEGVYLDADEAAYDEWIENLHNKGYKHIRKSI